MMDLNPVQNRILRNMKGGWILFHDHGSNFQVRANSGPGYLVARQYVDPLIEAELLAPHERRPESIMGLTEKAWRMPLVPTHG